MKNWKFSSKYKWEWDKCFQIYLWNFFQVLAWFLQLFLTTKTLMKDHLEHSHKKTKTWNTKIVWRLQLWLPEYLHFFTEGPYWNHIYTGESCIKTAPTWASEAHFFHYTHTLINCLFSNEQKIPLSQAFAIWTNGTFSKFEVMQDTTEKLCNSQCFDAGKQYYGDLGITTLSYIRASVIKIIY